MTQTHIHLGKNKITEEFMGTLNDHFKNHNSVKVTVLRGAGHDKEKIKEYSNEILEKLGKNYTAKIVGFTISIKKWRRIVR